MTLRKAHPPTQIGDTFGRLTVIEPSTPRGKKNARYWKCECSCGKTTVAAQAALRAGIHRSCGCSTVERMKARRTHGLKGTRIYRIWRSMIDRCTNVKHKSYSEYGGSGIEVCQRWKASITHMIADIGLPPSDAHSLDRYPNRGGNYEPGNVRWATPKEQTRNRSNTVLATIGGSTRPIAEWSEIYGVDANRTRKRFRAGWDILRALTEPADTRKSRRQVKKSCHQPITSTTQTRNVK